MRRVCEPMKHDPLRDGNDHFLSLVQGRELGLDCIVCVCHDEREIELKADRMSRVGKLSK